jgi:hypothetical protein
MSDAPAERNVLNVDAIRAFSEAAAEMARDARVGAWARSILPRYVIRHYERVLVLDRERDGVVVLRDPDLPEGGEPRRYEGEVPAWCARALDESRPVLFVRLDGPLQKRVRRTLAHLDAHPELAQSKLDFIQAEKMARQARRNARERRMQEIAAEGVPVFRWGDATVVQLTSAAALEGEGLRMWNCLAEYATVVREGAAEIYSVRDRAGASKAVLEVDREGYVLQIKGYDNGPVPAEWRGAVRAFIAERGYAVVNDIWNLADADTLRAGRDIADRNALVSAWGRALLRSKRYVGIDGIGAADAMQLTLTLASNRAQHSAHVRRVVFDALAPEGDAPFRERAAGGQRVYDIELSLAAIEVALPFFNLAKARYFAGLKPEDAVARRLLAGAQAALATLVFRAPERLHLLGPHTDGRGRLPHWASAADLLLGGNVDIRAVRAAKHRALRERLNRAKRALRGAHAEPSGPHLALRWLLDGGTGQYVI